MARNTYYRLLELANFSIIQSEYASNNHLSSYNWSIAFTPTAKDSIVTFIHTNNAVRGKLISDDAPFELRMFLTLSGNFPLTALFVCINVTMLSLAVGVNAIDQL
jgi:hypothetical protein